LIFFGHLALEVNPIMPDPRKPKSRTQSSSAHPALERRRQLQTLRARLQAERHAWSRWMTRLRRAFHAVEKLQRRITYLEKRIADLETA
jgi:hypothetical protein